MKDTSTVPPEFPENDEKVFLEKSKKYLQKQMERFHYSITQIVYNMGKLAGKAKANQTVKRILLMLYLKVLLLVQPLYQEMMITSSLL